MTKTSIEEAQTNAAARRAKGEFVRGVSGFRSVLGEDPDFPAEPQPLPPVRRAELPLVPPGNLGAQRAGLAG